MEDESRALVLQDSEMSLALPAGPPRAPPPHRIDYGTCSYSGLRYLLARYGAPMTSRALIQSWKWTAQVRGQEKTDCSRDGRNRRTLEC